MRTFFMTFILCAFTMSGYADDLTEHEGPCLEEQVEECATDCMHSEDIHCEDSCESHLPNCES